MLMRATGSKSKKFISSFRLFISASGRRGAPLLGAGGFTPPAGRGPCAREGGGTGEQRARGEKLEELPAARGLIERHVTPPSEMQGRKDSRRPRAGRYAPNEKRARSGVKAAFVSRGTRPSASAW